MTPTTPDDNHRWLHQLVGEWHYEMDSPEAGKTFTGRERVRKLGDLWVVGESDMPTPDGTTGHAIITLGFDPKKRKFVGTWVGTMMPNLWVYEGELDAARRSLSLYSVGPAFDESCMPVGEGTSRYRDTIELHGPDRRTFTGAVQQPDGTWKQFMKSDYRRTGS
ncbi:MAG TPA: DUF1579 domain-containing protein [Tepidisphaeraceae bacterium]|nr:DUF1579 domain-containing protein [Tepidisphaeraceae bacterium]